MNEKDNSTSQDVVQRKRAARSPSYPAIDLQVAMSKVDLIRQAEGNNYTSIGVALTDMGYGDKSGPGFAALSALKKYGLIDEEGSGQARRIRVSELANRILLDTREDKTERERLIKKAALSPSIYKNLWQKYGYEAPSNATLRHYLIFDRKFSDNASDQVIKTYNKTINFAQLSAADEVVPAGQLEDLESSDTVKATSRNIEPQGTRIESRMPMQIQFPISQTGWVSISISEDLSEETWDRMMAVLGAMKTGIVKQ